MQGLSITAVATGAGSVPGTLVGVGDGVGVEVAVAGAAGVGCGAPPSSAVILSVRALMRVWKVAMSCSIKPICVCRALARYSRSDTCTSSSLILPSIS